MQNWIRTLLLAAAALTASQGFAFHVKAPQHKELPARHVSHVEKTPARKQNVTAKKHGAKASRNDAAASKTKNNDKAATAAPRASSARKGRRARQDDSVDAARTRRGHLSRVTATRIVRGRKVRQAVTFQPSALRGSHDLQVLQNQEIDSFNLERIQTDSDLIMLENRGSLVRIPESGALHVNPQIEITRRYARPWTVEFLRDMSSAFYARFRHPIEVTSAVRTAP